MHLCNVVVLALLGALLPCSGGLGCRDGVDVAAKERGRSLFAAKMMNVRPPLLKQRAWVPGNQPHKLALAIIEPRNHPLLEPVVWSFAHAYGGREKNASLWVFHGNLNAESTRVLFGSWPHANLIHVLVEHFDIDSISTFMLAETFWQHFVYADYVLIFQTDSGIFQPVPDEWFNYTYVGAPWCRDWCHKGKCSNVGNGGLSLRKVSTQLDIVTKAAELHGGVEDVVFSSYNENKPTLEVAQRFSVEAVFYPEPVGVHNPWSYLSYEEVEQLLGSRMFLGERAEACPPGFGNATLAPPQGPAKRV